MIKGLLCLQLLSQNFRMISFVQWFNRCPSTNNKQIRKSAPKKIPDAKEITRRKTSQVHPSVSHSDFTMFVSNPNFPFFLRGMDHIMRSFLPKKNTHKPKHTNSLKQTPNTFPKPNGFPGFPNISLFSLWREVSVFAQGAKYSKNSSAKKTLLGNSAIMFTWRKKGDYGNYKCKGCEKQTVNIEEIHPCILHVCMYVYIYICKYTSINTCDYMISSSYALNLYCPMPQFHVDMSSLKIVYYVKPHT